MTSKGYIWTYPEKKYDKNSVIVNVPASIGLSKYYEFILRKIDGLDMLNPTEKELEEIEQEEKTENILSQLPKGDVTIH